MFFLFLYFCFLTILIYIATEIKKLFSAILLKINKIYVNYISSIYLFLKYDFHISRINFADNNRINIRISVKQIFLTQVSYEFIHYWKKNREKNLFRAHACYTNYFDIKIIRLLLAKFNVRNTLNFKDRHLRRYNLCQFYVFLTLHYYWSSLLIYNSNAKKKGCPVIGAQFKNNFRIF